MKWHHWHWLGIKGLILLAIIVIIIAVVRWWRRRLPRKIVLEIDFERGVVEKRPEDFFSHFSSDYEYELRELVDGIMRACADKRVVGMIARIGPSRMGMAHAQEIARAIEAFRAAGKRAICWCETLSEGKGGNVEYMLATSFDEVYVQPSGDVGFEALAMHQPFARELLDNLGIVPRLDHRREYKSAKYLLTEKEMPQPQRESMESLLSSWTDQIVRHVARNRKLDEARVRELMQGGPWRADQALEHKLIDGCRFRDEVYDKVKEEGKVLFLEYYFKKAGRRDYSKVQALTTALSPSGRGGKKKGTIAIIDGVGGVARGKNRTRSFPKSVTMGSEDVAHAFRQARENKKISAIVFRVDSPGGSAVASETIWREVKLAREEGKIVIVSMSNLAGSGGYYVAAPANKIVAEPGTITGSIGVVSGKMINAELWKKIGINWGLITTGEGAEMWSSLSDFSEKQWDKLQASLDAIYEDFKKKVAEGRGMTMEQVEEIAKGRIWTGEQAKANGLVDEIGGMDQAIAIARGEAGITGKTKVIEISTKRSLWQRFMSRERNSDEVMEAIQPIAQVLEEIRTAGVQAKMSNV